MMNNGVIPGLLNQLNFGMESSTAKPPASKQEIEKLQIEIISEENIKKFDLLECCICKDDYKVGDKVSQLQCGHYHHHECVVAWLNKQNNCPVCRFELKTDNLEYENKKLRSRTGNNSSS
jgi:transcription elongation factor